MSADAFDGRKYNLNAPTGESADQKIIVGVEFYIFHAISMYSYHGFMRKNLAIFRKKQ